MKMILLSFLVSILSTSANSSPEFLRPWRGYSSPEIMATGLQRKFSTLPLAGLAIEKHKYWSSYYWPLNKGNINLRWNAPVPVGFNLKSPSYTEALTMPMQLLDDLAPSEKFDLALGRYSYPLKYQVSKKISPYRSEWEGICHGWAPAALNHNEPTPKIITNPDGIKIPFGSSDIKALLSYYYAYYYDPVTTHQMGKRCNGRRHCDDDMNAGAFHIVLSNKLGLEGKGFIADIENGFEVWNQVAYSFRSKVLKKDLPPARDSAYGTVKVIRLKTVMSVVFNIVKNDWLPVIGTNLQTYKDLEYEYDLDLNDKGEIIGGDWRSALRPDFLWQVEKTKKFTGLLTGLEKLLNDKRGRTR